MFAALGLKLLNSMRRFAATVKCPKCGHPFKPGADREFTSWQEFIGRFPCPKCGFRIGIGEDASTKKANPPGPFLQPQNSKVGVHPISDRERIFNIPASGHWGGMLPITIFWNLFIPPMFYWFVVLGKWRERGPQIILSVFFVAGLLLIYGALRQRFASYLLFLGPEIVRLQRKFLLKKNYTLPTREIESVRRIVAYSHSTGGEDSERVDVPTYCIEVRAGFPLFQFGSAVPPADQKWLAWVIRDHVRRCGGTGLPEELSKRSTPIEPDNDE